jgi:hypothetical protein
MTSDFQFWANVVLTAALVVVTIYHAVTTRRMFLAQTDPAVRLNIENVVIRGELDNMIFINDFGAIEGQR